MKQSVLKAAALALSAVLMLSVNISPVSAAERRGSANYYSNQGLLQDDAFVTLPLSAVKASGWLENQLLLQKHGLSGHMHLFNEYNGETSRWLGAATGEAWERGTYYMRGLVALAFGLDDAELKERAMQWIDAIINSQQANGRFGPVALGDWWPAMPALVALRDYYEYTEYIGAPDTRILPFLERYFQFQRQYLPTYRLNNWADARGADNIDSVFWLYNRLYDETNPAATEWLLDLGNTLKSQSTDWTNQYNNTTARQHVVNTSQGLKLPAVWYQMSNSAADRNAAENGIFNWSIDHGRIDGLPNSDESARDNRATRGTETCGVVENLLSMEITGRILGEAWIGDYIERIAYNAMPAMLTPDSTGHVYFIQQNQVLATLGNHEFDNDHGDSAAFGAPDGYDCCFSNYHMGWPKFVQTMWMGTRDNGLAIVSYGPNSVTAKVADGKTAVFKQETDYPFKDTVNLSYGGENAAFELKLRIPEWAVNPVITVNGRVLENVVPGTYYTLTRDWQYGDVVQLTFPSEIEASTWYNNAVGIEKGALIYGLKIDEQWRRLDGTEGNDLREIKVAHKPEYPTREVYPASRWNYGLVLDYDNPAASFTVEESPEIALQPFSAETAPVTLKAVGQIVPEWTLDGNNAGPQPYITPYDESLTEPVELIPYGSGRLRISQFPRIGEPSETTIRNDVRDVTFAGEAYTEVDNVVVASANDYTLAIKGSGSGTVIINGKYSEAVSLDGGSATVSNLKTKTNGYFQFRHEQFNNVRFTEGLNITSIEVTPVGRTINDLVVSSATRTKYAMRFATNLTAQETPYRIVYGTEPGVYDKETSGFKHSTATVTGLEAEKTYYAKVIATINGIKSESRTYTFEPVSEDGALKPNPNVPTAEYGGFNSLNYMQADWQFYDPNNVISFTSDSPPGIRFNRSTDMKAVLEIDGAANWADYVAEATIAVDDLARNNCGLMLRVTNQGNGPDGYNGYFVGIGRIASVNGPGVMIGYADGGWHDLKPLAWPIAAATQYTIKVVAYGERFAVYVNDEFVTTFEDARFGAGTIGLRAYDEGFTAYNAKVRPITEDDLTVFTVEDDGSGLTPNISPDATYTGFGSVADVNAEWRAFGSLDSISVMENEGAAQVHFAANPDVKTMLTASADTAANPNTWTDYVAETKLSVDLANNNNCGLMVRSTNYGAGPDGYTGYFVGIGRVSEVNGTGVIIGRADGAWHTVRWIPWDIAAGTVYTLKAVTYGNRLAVYVDDALVTVYDGLAYAAGTVGLRSYNEAFKVYDVSVRNVTKADLGAFDYAEAPVFSDDFNDAAASDTRWTRYGSTGNISFGNGAIVFGSSTNVKAVAGQTDWTDYVYELDVRRTGSGGGDAGMMFRVTNPGSGADTYQGYYFGVTGTNYVIGWANNSWNQIANQPSDAVKPQNQYNHLKVIAYGNDLYFYVNGTLVYSMTDSRYPAGQIGMRSYNMAFTADNATVRAISAQELNEISTPKIADITVTGASSGNLIQLKFPKTQNCTSYKIAYGTEPGVYTQEITDITTSGYAANAITAGKSAFIAPAAGTYYVRFYGLNGSSVVAVSNELAITTGYEESTEIDSPKLAAQLSETLALDTSAFTNASLGRYTRAVALATTVGNDASAGQMTIGLARQLLMSAAEGTSPDLDFRTENAYAELSVGDDNTVTAEFSVINTSGSAQTGAICILAVYESDGRLAAAKTIAAPAAQNGVSSAVLSAELPEKGSAKAFIWDSESYAPLCIPATVTGTTTP